MANITRYTPFDDLFSDLTRGFWVRPFPVATGEELQMKVDVKEGDKAYTVRAEIPGVKKDDIQVDVNGDVVSLRAEVKREKEEKGEKMLRSERYYGMVSRSFSLPTEVDDKATVAKYAEGVLELTLPKKQGNGARRISVQ